MKKYISILSLAAAFLLQSCDRSEHLSGSEEESVSAGKSTQLLTEKLQNSSGGEYSSSNKSESETGEDDEPRKDKSHWRQISDTVRQ